MEEDKWDNLTDVSGAPDDYFTFSFIYNDKDTVKPEFDVVKFTGDENLSFVYDFYVTLRSTTDNIPALLGEVLLRPAVLCMVVQNHFSYYHGIVTEFRQIQRVGDYTQYELRLRSKMFLLYLNTRSDIYVGKAFGAIIDGVMKDNGFTSLDYELKLTGTHYDPLLGGYNRWSYVCQYEESDLNFLQRLMEREGVYYYFEQDQTWHDSLQDVMPEKMVITDTRISHPPATKTLQYKAVGTPGAGPAPETIFTMIMHQAAFPAKVILRNYNYNTAGMGTMSASADVGSATDVSGRVQTIYGENFSTAEEGQTLAGIRAEEIFCQTKVYYGMASGPGLIPGTLITIDDPGQTFSGDYLIIHAAHEGQQPLTGVEEEFQYNNTFTMIPAAVQFRSQRLTPKPKIHATMNAVIDGDLSTETPDIDPTLGRYKVRLPFAPEEGGDDFSNKWGKSTSSYHVRMASPFAGTSDKTHGMNFPLHKGAEVVLSFRDGDPDLPVISGAVFNSQDFNVVTDKNPKQHVIKTPGGNQIVMDDTTGEEYIYLFSPFGKQGHGIYIGKGGEDEGAFHVKSSGNKHEVVMGQEDSIVIGSENYVTIGSKSELMVGTASEFTMAMKSVFEWAGTIECKAGHHVEFGKTKETIKDKDDLLGTEEVVISAGLLPADKAVLSTLQKTLIFGGAAVGALLAAFGGDIASAAYPDEESGVAAMKQMGVSMAPIAVGAAAQVAALAYLVNKLSTELTNAISKIEMNDTGIKVYASPYSAQLAYNNGIQLLIGPVMATPTSSIKMTPGINESITIQKEQAGGKITVDAQGVALEQLPAANSVKVTSANVVIQKNGGGKITLAAADATMEQQPAGGKVVASANDIKIQHGNDYISVSSQTGIKLNFLGANLHAGPLSIDPTGIIQLG